MNLESPRVTSQRSQQEMYNFLNNVENYRQIMPHRMEKFEVTGPETFLFILKGMPKIELTITKKNEPKLVVLGSNSDKFNFSLNIQVEAVSESESAVQLLFDGKFNAMISMMAKGPLQKFINTLSENISRL